MDALAADCTVLVVGADAVARAQFLITFPEERYVLVFAVTVADALSIVGSRSINAAIVCEETQIAPLRQEHPQLAILWADARFADESSGAAQSQRGPADATLPSPFDIETFEARMAHANALGRRPTGPLRERQTPSTTFAWKVFRAQVESLSERLDRIDYYHLLGVRADADVAAIKTAYQTRALEFQPDRFHSINDDTLKETITRLFQRMTEAFRVLSNAQDRQTYDALRLQGDGAGPARLRLTPPLKRTARDPADLAQTAEGRRHLTQALIAERQGDIPAALVHVGLALRAEPENVGLQKKYVALRSAQGGTD